MNKEIHELINMKARKETLEYELGENDVEKTHLSHRQILEIEDDLRKPFNKQVMLDMVNLTIDSDERIIKNRH